MSSTITETVRHRVPAVGMELLEKREKLVRSTSIEKLRKFNAYICSQNFYILPGLLLWLKTSQSVFQSYLEKGFNYLNSTFFVFALKDALQNKLNSDKAVIAGDLGACLGTLRAAVDKRISLAYVDLKSRAFTLSVYFTVLFIFAELALCLQYLFALVAPLGFVFLMACLSYVTYLLVRIYFHNMAQLGKRRSNSLTPEEHIPHKIDLRLLEQTISNVNLL